MANLNTPKGTRDFLPNQALRRKYVFQLLESVFTSFGYLPIETPAMELTETLMGKYGDEGDRLIFKIMPRGEKLLGESSKIKSEEALRYDLTVPFARFVTAHRNELTFPFKRYQIQPVWRADRPQKGRYREFYQCDVDVLGSNALLNEVELLQIVFEVFHRLKLDGIKIKINNRKLLQGLADAAGASDKFLPMTIALDKLDKIGWQGVIGEWQQLGFDDGAISIIKDVVSEVMGDMSASDRLTGLERAALKLNNPNAAKGAEELKFMVSAAAQLGIDGLEIDLSLARGLNYYTGAIFEVVHPDFPSSICGGGRYDDLTGVFGWPGNSGVGISFGADRICDLLDQKNLFPENLGIPVLVLFANMGHSESMYALSLINLLRDNGISAMLYPDVQKLKKQFAYAEKLNIPFMAIVGEEEMNHQTATLKNLKTGAQQSLSIDSLIQMCASHDF
jgi:histidyl-tRNA synthetase